MGVKMYREIIIQNYGRELVYPMSAIRDEELFCQLMDTVGKVDTIVETGTYAGLSSMLLSEYANTVHTFDVIDHKHRKEIWEEFGVKNVVFHKIENDIEKEQILQGIDFQFAFIDGNHGKVGQDFLLLKKCGRILFHDYHTGFPADNCRTAVVNFVDSLEGNKVIKEPFALWESI